MATKSSNRRFGALRAAGLMITCAIMVGPVLGEASATTDPAGSPAQWHAQKLEFTYIGYTAFYTCVGLESKVRAILLTFGARDDAKVKAVGCDRAQNQPNKVAGVEADFNSLAPASDAAASGNVQAVWSKVRLAPNRPTSMGTGECELVEQMRPMIEKAFALRNADYRAYCVPKQISIADYSVNAEVLTLVTVAH